MPDPSGSDGGPFLLGPGAMCSCWAVGGLVVEVGAAVEVVAAVEVLSGRLLPPHLGPTSRRRPSPLAAAAPWRSCRYFRTPIPRRLASGLFSADPPSAPSPLWEQPPGPGSWTPKRCLI